MPAAKRGVLTAMVAAVLCYCAIAEADPPFTDTFSTAATYPPSNATYTVTDGPEFPDVASTWTAGGGSLSYSRSDVGNTNYDYKSSVFLTNGSTPSTGNTAGLSSFTVTGVINDIPPQNSAQPGLIISGSTSAGGYLLEADNRFIQNGAVSDDFALLSESGTELLSDEESTTDTSNQDNPTPNLIKDFGTPTPGHNYAISVTESRPLGGNPSFDVVISDLTQPSPSPFYSGTVVDANDPSDFGGTQIGYRVRDPLGTYTVEDTDLPSFGTLSLDVPEPSSLGMLGAAVVLLLRRRRRN